MRACMEKPMLCGDDSGSMGGTVLLVLWFVFCIFFLSLYRPSDMLSKKHCLSPSFLFNRDRRRQLICKLCAESFLIGFSLSLRFVGEIWCQCPAVTAPTWTAWGRSPRRNSFRNPTWVTLHLDPVNFAFFFSFFSNLLWADLERT